MAHILIIEDEIGLRSTVARAMMRIGEVSDAGTLAEALVLIDQHPPDVVISDIDLPERSGLELLGELGRRHLHTPVIFVSGYLNAYRSQIPQHADVEVLEKPVGIEELRQVVQRRLGERRVSGEFAPFTVSDYLQLASMGRHSVVIEIERDGRPLGNVVVCSGEAWAATDVIGDGQAALARLAFARDSVVLCSALAEEPGPRSLEGDWEFALMEAARLSDEERRSGDEDPYVTAVHGVEDLPALAEAEPDPAAEAFERAWNTGVEALLDRRYDEALAAFLQARDLRPEDRKVLANIKRLAELGFAEPDDSTAGSI